MKPPYCPICSDPVVEVRIDADRIELQPCGHAVTDTKFWTRVRSWLQATEEETETAPPIPQLDGAEESEARGDEEEDVLHESES